MLALVAKSLPSLPQFCLIACTMVSHHCHTLRFWPVENSVRLAPPSTSSSGDWWLDRGPWERFVYRGNCAWVPCGIGIPGGCSPSSHSHCLTWFITSFWDRGLYLRWRKSRLPQAPLPFVFRYVCLYQLWISLWYLVSARTGWMDSRFSQCRHCHFKSRLMGALVV